MGNPGLSTGNFRLPPHLFRALLVAFRLPVTSVLGVARRVAPEDGLLAHHEYAGAWIVRVVVRRRTRNASDAVVLVESVERVQLSARLLPSRVELEVKLTCE